VSRAAISDPTPVSTTIQTRRSVLAWGTVAP
jgi:hypothetical protein